MFQWPFGIRNAIFFPFYLSWMEHVKTGKLISGLGELARRAEKDEKGTAKEL